MTKPQIQSKCYLPSGVPLGLSLALFVDDLPDNIGPSVSLFSEDCVSCIGTYIFTSGTIHKFLCNI